MRVKTEINAILREPFERIGKPEPLKFGLSGTWSRRIDDMNQIVYIVTVDKNLT